MRLGEALREIVELQARAHISGDHATFASFMTPQALLQVRGDHPRPRRHEILAVQEQGATGESAVRYIGRGSYVLRQRWERSGGAWKTVDARRPAGEVTLPLLRRLLDLFARGSAQRPQDPA